jgi:hypothetical protein
MLNANSISKRHAFNQNPNQHRNRLKTNRSTRQQRSKSKRHPHRPKNNNSLKHQTMQRKTTNANIGRAHNQTKNIHNSKTPSTRRLTIYRRRKKIWRTLQAFYKLAKKLSDPSIKSIRLYDLRHAYITKQLRRTQNAETVRIIVGHKKLNTTQKYLHLLGGNSGEWIVEGTTDKNRAMQLIAADFIYVATTPDGTMMFKKAP